MVSAKHRYELIVKDVTWKEAKVLCHESGGYLATITSHEEYERLQEQMISGHKEDITYMEETCSFDLSTILEGKG